MAVKRPGERKREAALGRRGGHGDGPALADLTQHRSAREGVVGEEGLLEEDLGEPLVAVESTEPAHRDAGQVERDEQVGESSVAGAVGLGAEETEQVGAEGAASGPGLLAVEDPSAALGRRVHPPRRLRSEARSDPALGSDQPWHQRSSPRAMRGRMCSFCSGLPKENTLGASRKMPFCVIRGGPPAR